MTTLGSTALKSSRKKTPPERFLSWWSTIQKYQQWVVVQHQSNHHAHWTVLFFIKSLNKITFSTIDNICLWFFSQYEQCKCLRLMIVINKCRIKSSKNYISTHVHTHNSIGGFIPWNYPFEKFFLLFSPYCLPSLEYQHQ